MYLVFLLPVLTFLGLLLLFDSFKLIKNKTLLLSAAWGLAAAFLALGVNIFLMSRPGVSFNTYSHYIAPFIEEALKALIFVFLIRKGYVGFLIDGAIYGFAAGAVFSLVENVDYFLAYSDASPMLWIIRGFGTALMHGGTTSVILMFAMGSVNTRQDPALAMLRGYFLAVIIHGAFNYLMLVISPTGVALAMVIILPLALAMAFMQHERSLRKWLDVELSQEVRLLKMIREGKFSHTKTGEYILSIRRNFDPEAIFDMMNYIYLYTELSLKAKKIMMLREAGFPAKPDSDIPDKLNELKALRKIIGRTGLIAVSPILRMGQKDVWKLNMLADEQF